MDVPSFFFLSFFYLFGHSTYAALCFLDWFSMIVSIKRLFRVNIIYTDYWTSVAWNQRIFGYALLHHHIEPQCHICPDQDPFYILQTTVHFLQFYCMVYWSEMDFFRCRSYTFVLLNFRKPVSIHNMCKIKNFFAFSRSILVCGSWVRQMYMTCI